MYGEFGACCPVRKCEDARGHPSLYRWQKVQRPGVRCWGIRGNRVQGVPAAHACVGGSGSRAWGQQACWLRLMPSCLRIYSPADGSGATAGLVGQCTHGQGLVCRAAACMHLGPDGSVFDG